MSSTPRRRERLTIQSKNLVDNGRGGRSRPPGGEEWLNGPTVWGEVIALRGDEALQNAVLRAIQLFKVTIPARVGLTAAHRLFWRGQALAIKAMAYSADRRDIVMTCESGGTG